MISEDSLTEVTAVADVTSTPSTIAPVLEDNSISLTTITSDVPSSLSLTTITTRELQLSHDSIDLVPSTLTTDSMTLVTDSMMPLTDSVTPLTDSMTQCDSTLRAEDLALTPPPLPLVHPPTAITDEENVTTCSTISNTSMSSRTLTLTETNTAIRGLSLGQLPNSELLTDSQSTGEVPSLLTFSEGEFGLESTLSPSANPLLQLTPQPVERKKCPARKLTRELQLLQFAEKMSPEEREKILPNSPLIESHCKKVLSQDLPPVQTEKEHLPPPTGQNSEEISGLEEEEVQPAKIETELQLENSGSKRENDGSVVGTNGREHSVEVERENLNHTLATDEEEEHSNRDKPTCAAPADNQIASSIAPDIKQTYKQENRSIDGEGGEKTEADEEDKSAALQDDEKSDKRERRKEDESATQEKEEQNKTKEVGNKTTKSIPNCNLEKSSFGQADDSKQTAGVQGNTDNNGIASYFMEQRRELGQIIRSELRRYLQGQPCQDQERVEDFMSVNQASENSGSTIPTHKETSTSDLCISQLRDTLPPPMPSSPPPPPPPLPPPPPSLPLLLLPEPLSPPATSLQPQLHTSSTRNILREEETKAIMPELPLLRLDNRDTSSPVVQEPQLPQIPLRRRSTHFTDPLPLLSLEEDGPKEPFFPSLMNIPPISSQSPLSFPSQQEETTLPLLHYPHPAPPPPLPVVQQHTLLTNIPFLPPTAICSPLLHTATRPPLTPPFPLLLPPPQTLPLVPPLPTQQFTPQSEALPKPAASLVAPREETNTEPNTHTKQPVSPSASQETDKEILEKENRRPGSRAVENQHTKLCETSTNATPTISRSPLCALQPPPPPPPPPPPRPPPPPTHLVQSTNSVSTCEEAPGSREPTTRGGDKLDNEEVAPMTEATNCQQLSPRKVIPGSENEGCLVVDQPSCQTPPDSPHYSYPEPPSSTYDARVNDDDDNALDNIRDIPELLLLSTYKHSTEERVVQNEHGGDKVVSSGDFTKVTEEIHDDKVADTGGGQVPPFDERPKVEEREEEEGGGGGGCPMEEAKGEILGQLRKLETQLTAIETRARTVEGELLVSNQLLGTIEELQGVHRKTRVSPRIATDPSLTDEPAHVLGTLSKSVEVGVSTTAVTGICVPNNTAPSVTASSVTAPSVTATGTNVSTSLNIGDRVKDSLPTPLSQPQVTTTTVSESPMEPTHCSISTPSFNPSSITSTFDSIQVPSATSYEAIKRIKVPKSSTKEPISNRHVEPAGSQPLTGQCSRRTLRKWVTTRKRERSRDSGESQKTHKNPGQMFRGKAGHLRRTQSQEHKDKRMTEALALMEDILSTEVPSSAIPVTSTSHRSPSGPLSTTRPHHRHSLTVPVKRNNHETDHTPKERSGLVRELGRVRCSSTEGLTPQEQLKMAHIMTWTELSSVSSGSVASTIDWELVDQLIDN